MLLAKEPIRRSRVCGETAPGLARKVGPKIRVESLKSARSRRDRDRVPFQCRLRRPVALKPAVERSIALLKRHSEFLP